MIPALYSEVNILCILFLLLIYFKVRTGPYLQNGQRLFLWVLLSNCVLFALDVIWIFVDSRSNSTGIGANWTVNALYYVTSGAVSFFWFLYSETQQQSRLVKDRRHVFFCTIPMLLLAVLTLISLKTGWLFYVDDQNVYHRGPLYGLQLLLSYGYIVFTAAKALARSFHTVSYTRKKEYRTLAAFVLPSLIAGFIQVWFPGISLLCVGTTFGILYVFTTMQEQMIFIDSLTGLNNRNRMMRHLADEMTHCDAGTHLFLVMMDLDYFKQINDKYGHVEGDAALRRTADALKACGRDQHSFIARYGGDEFAVICKLAPGENIENFCCRVREAMRLESQKGPYTLSLSMGYAEYRLEIKTDQDFIKQADAELYRAKQAR